MLLPSDCIILRSIKYNDTRAIVHCLSREAGRISFLVNDGNSPAARRRRALMMPGASFHGIIDIRENRSLQFVSDIMPSRIMLLDNPVATSVILFVCDFLSTILRDNQPDDTLYDFVDDAISRIISSKSSIANAPIAFLFAMQQFMGITPDFASYQPGFCFDFAAGMFRQYPPLHSNWIDASQAEVLFSISRINLRNMHLFKFSRVDRNNVLDLLIKYYSIHFGAIRNLQSLPVVRAIFD